MTTLRDYSLTGTSTKRAVEIGLATAEWYHTDIPRKEMKALMKREDGPALRDMALFYGLMLATAAAAILLWPSWWAAPFLFVYGTLYTSGADSRWHEAGHGTAFRTDRYNTVVYQIACFCLLRNPVIWRWSHARHHTDTIIVGRDPEIVAMRPPDIAKVVALFFGLETLQAVPRVFRLAFSGLTPDEKDFVPEAERPKAIRVARVWAAILIATLLAAIAFRTVLPLMLIVGPALWGSWHYVMTGLLQHTGMADNVIDHRLNSRTVLMNPVSRFLYWNMNYHVEHHMFPMVPYHRLPELHAAIGHDLPAPNRSIAEGLREVATALRRQLADPEYRIEKALPPSARPYRYDLHAEALGFDTVAAAE